MAKYSREQRDRAVDLYIKYERCAADVIRELGYPSKGVLLSWYADRLAARYRGDGFTVPATRTDRLYLGHADHCLSGPFPNGTRSTIRLRPTGGRHAFPPKPEKPS